jgi:hypothetical protein
MDEKLRLSRTTFQVTWLKWQAMGVVEAFEIFLMVGYSTVTSIDEGRDLCYLQLQKIEVPVQERGRD